MIDTRFAPITIADSSDQRLEASLAIFRSPDFLYRLLHIKNAADSSWYLYASPNKPDHADEEITYVLGVFDTCGQASYFLDLHLENELKVPALLVTGKQRSIYIDPMGALQFPRYEGVYRVGFKSYTVEVDRQDPQLRVLNYIQSYKTEYLGVYSEKDACIAIYSHFDQRLRGCKMC